MTLSVATDHASLPIAHRLYLPRPWADDPVRRARVGVPVEVTFQTKPEITLSQIRAALQTGVAPATVLADAGYGVDTEFRDGITTLGLSYVVGVQSTTSLWPPGVTPLPPKKWSGNGRPPSLRLCPLAWCRRQRSTTVSGRVRPGSQGVVADNLTMAVLLNGAMVSSVMYRAL